MNESFKKEEVANCIDQKHRNMSLDFHTMEVIDCYGETGK